MVWSRGNACTLRPVIRASEVTRGRASRAEASRPQGGVGLAERVVGSSRTREIALVSAMLGPVIAHPDIRRALGALDAPRRLAIGLMAAATLAGHYVLGNRSFPFVNWDMYTSPVCGDPVIFEYHLRLGSGTVVPLALSHLLGPVSAARLMEALRRQVSGLQTEPGGDRRREHESALRAIAAWYRRRHPDDPPVSVLVSERTLSLATGRHGASRPLWTVEIA